MLESWQIAFIILSVLSVLYIGVILIPIMIIYCNNDEKNSETSTNNNEWRRLSDSTLPTVPGMIPGYFMVNEINYDSYSTSL